MIDMPLAIALMGLSQAMVLFVIAFGAVWPVLLATVHGFAAIEPRLVEEVAGLYESLGGVATAVLEQALVEQRAIAPLGFRFVGVRR